VIVTGSDCVTEAELTERLALIPHYYRGQIPEIGERSTLYDLEERNVAGGIERNEENRQFVLQSAFQTS
jgi:hypothetical protein